eukprot:UN13443
MCVIPQQPAPLLTPTTLKAFPCLDVLLCGSLGLFFMYRLKQIRKMVIEMSARRDNYNVNDPTSVPPNKAGKPEKNSEVTTGTVTTVEMSGQTQQSCSPTYIETTTGGTGATRDRDKNHLHLHVHIDGDQSNTRVPAPDKSFAVDLHVLMWKQSILIAITLVTTLCTTAWVWVLPMLTNLLVYDCIMNAICNHLMFSFCNSFWIFVQRKFC